MSGHYGTFRLPLSSRPNHCGRHHGKINRHRSTYVKVGYGDTLFDELGLLCFLTEKPWEKLFEYQAEVFVWLIHA